MEEATKEQIDFMERTLKNYYYLLKQANESRKQALYLENRIEDERKTAGISYDSQSGTYNNTDTPYICSIIHDQAACDLDALHYDEAANDLDKRNKITERMKNLSEDQKLTINWLCKKRMTQQQYAEEEGVSRQAIKDRLDNALKRMMEVE